MQNAEEMNRIPQWERLDICERATTKYGVTHQAVKAMEELGELEQALAKVVNNDFETYAQRVDAIDHVAEEIADAQIMLWQMISAFDLDVEGLIDYKLKRLETRMNGFGDN